METKPIKILIADDHPVVRQGLKFLLDTEPGFEVVGEASNGEQAVELTRDLGPDVILMDLVMPEVDGVEATRRILQRCSEATRVLVLTNYSSDEKLFPALDAGALGFLLKDSTADELVQAIRQVSRGLSSLSPGIARRLVGEVSHESGVPGEPLTRREREILRVMAHGHSNDDIAKELCISPATVRTHITHILAKLNVTRRTQAILYALRHGIASLDDE